MSLYPQQETGLENLKDLKLVLLSTVSHIRYPLASEMHQAFNSNLNTSVAMRVAAPASNAFP